MSATMYPSYPLPRHITALYVVAVASSIALFSQSIASVGADILVYSEESHRQIEVVFRDMTSTFGESLPMEGLKGYFIYADPIHACSPVKPPPYDVSNPTGHWILLIMRGNCSFEMKVRMAQLSNYDAAIVHNVNSSELEPMSATNSTGIFIPSVFVGENTGIILKSNYQFDKGFYILINDDEPFSINTHLLLPFVIVVGLCTLVMVIFMIVKCCQERRQQRRHRLPASSLRQIPTSKFCKGDPYETCAICLEDYQEGEKLRVLPCHHAYHSKCIDPWLTRNRRVCPVCKRKVFAQDEHLSDDSDLDNDDDTTPLVQPGQHRTQGGTFDRQTLFLGGQSLSESSSSSSSNSYSSSFGPQQESVAEIEALLSRIEKYESDFLNSPGDCDAGTANGDISSISAHILEEFKRYVTEGDSQGATACYNMSSGEHSINSRPIDLDFSDDHFERGSTASQWGSRVALLGSRSEADSCVLDGSEPAEAAEEAVPGPSTLSSLLPSVQVRSSTTGQDSSEKKPAVV